MNIVLLESLSVEKNVLSGYVNKLIDAGHSFTEYKGCDDIEVLKERVKDADVLILANKALCGEIIKAAKNLKYINIAFTGTDHVDVKTAKEAGVQISNASGYSTDSVAELTLGMMLSLLRKAKEFEIACRNGKTSKEFMGNELRGKTVGIVGTGAIGTAVAKLCGAFGCKMVAYNGFSKKDNTDLIEYMPLKELLQTSDIVTLHCPLTVQSRNLINEETIKYMKPSAYLLNAARGGVIDSNALAKALDDDKLAGAWVDVYEYEPPIENNHPLLNCKNVIVTPHVAFASEESMLKRAEIVFENLNQWLCGNHINKV